MRPMLPLLFSMACGAVSEPTGLSTVLTLDVNTRITVDERGRQNLRVQVSGPVQPGWKLDKPLVDGLTFEAATERVERLGDRVVTTRHYPFKGGEGRYIIEGLCARPVDAEPACAQPLYVDIGAPPDRSSMADISEPEPLWPLPPWRWIVAGTFSLVMLLAGAGWAMRKPEEVVYRVIEEEPPDVVALRAWEAVRADVELDPHDKALQLSSIFRAYVERVLDYPARAFTTTETLAHLRSLAALAPENTPRARRLLRATDRVKYAEATPNEDFFDDLDSDLRAFVDSTRTRSWEGA